MRKALSRLHQMVRRSGILVFASHSNEFLARLCTAAIWLEHGEIKMIDAMENVVRADEGNDAARYVATIRRDTRR
jgi:ABC-2 type transport system ATP-binding protein